MATWHTTDTAREVWTDAKAMQNDVLTSLLTAAQEQCIEYGGVLADPEVIPERWQIAQLMQARAIWQAQKARVDDSIGSDGQTVTVYPMDWQVKSLLRPARGVPRIG